MPELPEVEALAAFLRERATGHAVAHAYPAAISVLKTYDPPPTALTGQVVGDVRRHGKFLDLSLGAPGNGGAPPLHLVIHLARAGGCAGGSRSRRSRPGRAKGRSRSGSSWTTNRAST